MLSTKTANNPSVAAPIFTLLSVWIIYLSLLGLLQCLGLKFGFNVWPLGEERNFLGFMLNAKGAKVAHEFWNMNDRNPLSVWWWIAISHLIHSFDWAIYAARKCLDPFLAVVTFLLLDRLGRRQCRTFAFSVALIVLSWNFSQYFEQIIWVYLGALGTSLLTIHFYCRYVDSNRSSSYDLAIALILYLFTIATYSLLPGAIIAITCLAFFRNPNPELQMKWRQRFRNTLIDVSFFLIIFLIYNGIWYTVNRNAEVFYVFNWSIFTKQFLQSIRFFIYHPSYHSLLTLTFNDFTFTQIILIFCSAFVFFCSLFFIYPANKVGNFTEKLPMGWIVAIMLSISVSIIILESTSTIWYPGSRALMVQQVWQPLLYISLVFLIAKIIPVPQKNKLIIGLIALLGAYSILLGIDYNHHLVLRTQYQRTLAEGIKNLHIPPKESPFYLVRTIGNHIDLNTIPLQIAIYGQTMLHQPVSLRVIPAGPNSEFAACWRTRFDGDKQGAFNAGPICDTHPVPYQKLWIVFYDGNKVWVPKKITQSDFEGLEVDWNRNAPIDQNDKLQRLKISLSSTGDKKRI